MSSNSLPSVHFLPSDYAKIDESPNYMAPIFDDVLNNHSDATVVDIGCGNGHFTSYLKTKNPKTKLWGLDSSEFALQVAQDRGFDFVVKVGDLNHQRLPLPDQMADLIILKDVLEHLLNPEFVLLEAKRLLKPQGRLLVMVPNHFPILSRIKFLFTANIDTQNYFPDAKLWNFPHLRFFTSLALEELLELSGFRELKNYNFHFKYLPLLHRLPFGLKLARFLVKKYPTAFATAFVVLVELKH